MLAEYFKGFITNAAWYTVLPVVLGVIFENFGFNKVHVMIVSAVIIWMVYTELRVQDLQNVRNQKKKRKK